MMAMRETRVATMGEEEDRAQEEDKTKKGSPSPEAAKLARQQQQQQRQKSENKDRPGLALFPGLANFKDDENKKPPPKGGAGVFSGFAGFAPKPSTSKQQSHRGGGEPSSSILEEKEDENSKPSSSFKPSAFAKELGIVTSLSNFDRDDEKETTTRHFRRKKDTQFAKELF